MLEDIRLTHHDPSLEQCQSGGAIPKPAPSVVVLAVIPKGADPEIRARGQHLYRTSLDAALNSTGWNAVQSAKSLGKGRIRTGVERQLSDYFFMRPP